MLSRQEQHELVFHHATYLATRTEGKHRINLHSLSDFFVEVYFDPDLNAIGELVSFQANRMLDEYLDWIRIDEGS